MVRTKKIVYKLFPLSSIHIRKGLFYHKSIIQAVSDIDHSPQDDTIAFYFLSGEEGLKPNEGRGFTHAARYVEDVTSWVSDMWASKLGRYKLLTHGEDDLNNSIYGNPLCYLVPEKTNTETHDPNDL